MKRGKVIHVRDAPPNWRADPQYVYIGRPFRGMHGQWGNPFKVGRDGTREVVVWKLYKPWMREKMRSSRRVTKLIADLRDKTLICWCKPLLCHGDALLELAQEARESLLADDE